MKGKFVERKQKKTVSILSYFRVPLQLFPHTKKEVDLVLINAAAVVIVVDVLLIHDAAEGVTLYHEGHKTKHNEILIKCVASGARDVSVYDRRGEHL